MSENLAAKIAKLESLSKRELDIIDLWIKEPGISVKEICERLERVDQTIRGNITSIYKNLGVPEWVDKDGKRKWVLDQYQEAYQERYPKVGEIPSEPKIDEVKTEEDLIGEISKEPFREETKNTPVEEEKIEEGPILFKNPPPPQGGTIEPRRLINLILLGLFLVAIAAIIAIYSVMNSNPVSHPTVGVAPAIDAPVTQPEGVYVEGDRAIIRADQNNYVDIYAFDFVSKVFPGCSSAEIGEPGFAVAFVISNTSYNPFLIKFESSGFSAVDDTGKTYEFSGSGFDNCTSRVGSQESEFKPGEVKMLRVAFKGEFPPEAKYVYITINDISGSGKIVFRKDL